MSQGKKIPRDMAMQLANILVQCLTPVCQRVEIAGSLRRGKQMVECVVAHPALAGIRRLLLATRDAHGLYREYGGFVPLPTPERWMERRTNTP